eukprot:9196635-Pyramimonas_sp.AAC.1
MESKQNGHGGKSYLPRNCTQQRLYQLRYRISNAHGSSATFIPIMARRKMYKTQHGVPSQAHHLYFMYMRTASHGVHHVLDPPQSSMFAPAAGAGGRIR